MATVGRPRNITGLLIDAAKAGIKHHGSAFKYARHSGLRLGYILGMADGSIRCPSNATLKKAEIIYDKGHYFHIPGSKYVQTIHRIL